MSEQESKSLSLCIIEGCQSLVIGRGWCKSHYQRWYKYGDAMHFPYKEKQTGVCRLMGCDGVVKNRTNWCEMHYSRNRRRGNPTLSGIGADSLFWKDDALYRSVHIHIEKLIGKAIKYICVDCKLSTGRHWSFNWRTVDSNKWKWSDIWSPYSNIIENYSARCIACARSYDRGYDRDKLLQGYMQAKVENRHSGRPKKTTTDIILFLAAMQQLIIECADSAGALLDIHV